jgi:hypothetical protein
LGDSLRRRHHVATAYAFAGLSGQKAVVAVFGTVYTGDVLLNTALGLYKPTSWSADDWAIDIDDKFVHAAATGAIFEQVVGPDDGS